MASGNTLAVGVVDEHFGYAGDYIGIGDDAHGWAMCGHTSMKGLRHDGKTVSCGDLWHAGDVIGVSIDADRGVISWRRNDVEIERGVAHFGSCSSGHYVLPAVTADYGAVAQINFGSRPFHYDVPAGSSPVEARTLQQKCQWIAQAAGSNLVSGKQSLCRVFDSIRFDSIQSWDGAVGGVAVRRAVRSSALRCRRVSSVSLILALRCRRIQGCFVRAGGRDDQLTRTLEPGGVPNPKGMYMRTVSVSDGVYCEMDGLVITSGKVRVESRGSRVVGVMMERSHLQRQRRSDAANVVTQRHPARLRTPYEYYGCE